MQAELAATPKLEIVAEAVEDLILDDGVVVGVLGASGKAYRAARVVLTTGTFLKGVILGLGDERIPVGRVGDAPAGRPWTGSTRPACAWAAWKTGTPARLDGRTIAWDQLEMQAADDEPVPFSFLTDTITVPQIECGITCTTAETFKIIGERLGESAVYGGGDPPASGRAIALPSRTRSSASRTRPATRSSWNRRDWTTTPSIRTVISTLGGRGHPGPLPAHHAGLEQVAVFRYGYAIEYDYVDPRELCVPDAGGQAAAGASTWPARSTAPPDTRRRAPGLVAGLERSPRGAASGADPAGCRSPATRPISAC